MVNVGGDVDYIVFRIRVYTCNIYVKSRRGTALLDEGETIRPLPCYVSPEKGRILPRIAYDNGRILCIASNRRALVVAFTIERSARDVAKVAV